MAAVPGRSSRGKSPASTTDSTISLGSYHAVLLDEHDPRRATFLNREHPNCGQKAPLGLLIPEETTTTARWACPSEQNQSTEAGSTFQSSSHRNGAEAPLANPAKRGRSHSVPDCSRPIKRPVLEAINPSLSQRLADHAAGYDEAHDADTQEYVASQQRGRVAANLLDRPARLLSHLNPIECDIDTVLVEVDEQVLRFNSGKLLEEWRNRRSIRRLLEPDGSQQSTDHPSNSASATSANVRIFHSLRARVRRDKLGNVIKGAAKGSPESRSPPSKI